MTWRKGYVKFSLVFNVYCPGKYFQTSLKVTLLHNFEFQLGEKVPSNKNKTQMKICTLKFVLTVKASPSVLLNWKGFLCWLKTDSCWLATYFCLKPRKQKNGKSSNAKWRLKSCHRHKCGMLDSCLLPNQLRFRVAGLEDLAKHSKEIFYVFKATFGKLAGRSFKMGSK